MRLILFRQMLVTIPGAKEEVLFRVCLPQAAENALGRLLWPPFVRSAWMFTLRQRPSSSSQSIPLALFLTVKRVLKLQQVQLQYAQY